MPFAAPTNFDEEEKKKQNQGGGVGISGANTSFATNLPGQEQAQGGSRQKSSGQYANIQSYLDANKTQADGMGQRIAGEVSNKAEDATQKIQTFESQAPTVQAYDPNSAIQNATSLSDEEKSQYKTMKATGGYTGPQTVDQAQGYQDAVSSAQGAHQSVKNAGTETGQQQLLKETYARPNYSAGENRLDQVLLQNSAGSKSAMENLTSKYAGLDQMLSGATTNVGNAINQANQTSLSNRQAFNPAEDAARKGLLDPIQARADQANRDNPELIKRVQDDAADETLSEETLALLGLGEGQKLFDLDLASYLSPNHTQVSVDNGANDDERAKYAALSSLFEDPTMNQITPGGKNISPVGFNQAQFDSDLAGKQAEFDRWAAAETFQGAGATGGSLGYDGHWGANADVSSTVADYLAGKSPEVRVKSGVLGGGAFTPDEAATLALKEQALQDMYQKILAAIDSQHYNRQIKKG